MGKSAGLYVPEFPQGTRVRIASGELLEGFRPNWRFHNPLLTDQLAFAGVAVVDSVAFYHGGDELYQLRDIPGLWHEACLESGSDRL
jgi:hypothetical protein